MLYTLKIVKQADLMLRDNKSYNNEIKLKSIYFTQKTLLEWKAGMTQSWRKYLYHAQQMKELVSRISKEFLKINKKRQTT